MGKGWFSVTGPAGHTGAAGVVVDLTAELAAKPQTGQRVGDREPAYTRPEGQIGGFPEIDIEAAETFEWVLDAFGRRLDLTPADREKLRGAG